MYNCLSIVKSYFSIFLPLLRVVDADVGHGWLSLDDDNGEEHSDDDHSSRRDDGHKGGPFGLPGLGARPGQIDDHGDAIKESEDGDRHARPPKVEIARVNAVVCKKSGLGACREQPAKHNQLEGRVDTDDLFLHVIAPQVSEKMKKRTLYVTRTSNIEKLLNATKLLHITRIGTIAATMVAFVGIWVFSVTTLRKDEPGIMSSRAYEKIMRAAAA